MKNLFFPGAPLAQISPTLKRVMRTTTDLRNFIKRSLLGFDLIIGQGNRPDRLHSQLVEWGILPPFDIFFTGSRAGAEQIAQHWVEREVEEALEEQTPYIWDSPGMWQKFWEFLEGHNKKRILLISSAPRGQHERIAEFQNILFPAPSPAIAFSFEADKRRMSTLYESLGIPYPARNFDSIEAVNQGFKFFSCEFKSETLVVQATRGSGGVTEKSSTQALFFVQNQTEFRSALTCLQGEGPVRIMPKFTGIPSNSGALTLPFATYISGIPTVKPCGIVELGAKPGTSGGNQWDYFRFPQNAIDSQFEQLGKVGEKMAETGFFGVFGLDPIMPLNKSDMVFNSEINARSQGPDPQRALAAYKIGIPTLEEMQLAFYLGCPKEAFPAVDDYNFLTKWLCIPPYLKLFPKEDQIVRRNLNGYWNFEMGKLISTDAQNGCFKITGAPNIGQKMLRSSPDNFAYVKFLDVGMKIYTEDSDPRLTPFAEDLVSYIYANI